MSKFSYGINIDNALTPGGSTLTLTANDSGSLIVVNQDMTITLPDASTDGLIYKFAKNFKSVVTGLIIDAASGDRIADSSNSGSISNDSQTEDYATVTLISIDDRWVILEAMGSWETT